MKIASVANVKAQFSSYLKASENGPVIVTRNGKPAAVILAISDEEELERLILAYSPKFQKLIQEAQKHIQETGGIPHEEFWRELDEDK